MSDGTLLTREGRLRAAQNLFDELEHAREPIHVKAAEAQLKVLRFMDDLDDRIQLQKRLDELTKSNSSLLEMQRRMYSGSAVRADDAPPIRSLDS